MSNRTGNKARSGYWANKVKEKTRDSMQALCERVEAQNQADEKKRQLLKKQEDTPYE